MDAALWLLPVVGALIGWLTNEVAVRMLFRPKRPLRLPLSPFTFQGVLPRRHADLAASIGRTVADDLLPASEILAHLDMASFKARVVHQAGEHVATKIHGHLPRFLPANVRRRLGEYVRDAVEREAEAFTEQLADSIGDHVVSRIDVQRIVEQKMLELDLDSLEGLARRIAGKELQAIVVFGAVLGFLIGLLQMAVVAWLLPVRVALGG